MRCTNSNVGTFNHECGAVACWRGTHADGHQQHFCDGCKEHGDEARRVKQWEEYAPPFGKRLPLFPTIYATPSNPLTEDRIERTIERLTDRADAAFMRGEATQDEYDRWNVALNAFCREMFSALELNPTRYP